MKVIYYILLISLFCLAACNNNSKPEESEQDKLLTDIQTQEGKLYKETEPDKDLAHDMIGKYVHYANKYPEDSLSAEFLFKASEIAMNFEQPHNAINYLTRIENNYKNYNKYAVCIFLKAYIYDYYINNTAKAKEYYEIFINNYPNHYLVEDAKASLSVIGLTDEQIIKLFAK